MLAIVDLDGNNLSVAPPPDQFQQVISGANAQVSIQARIIEDDTDLPSAWISGTLDWHDGSRPTVFDAAQGTITVDETKGLPPGVHFINLQGHNFVSPLQTSASVNFAVQIVRADDPGPPLELIFGPILPRDVGAPNANTWNMDRGVDLAILESSVKMLLITARGERIMEPTYGTNLRRLIFESNSAAIESVIQQEIIDAITKFEPRVRIQAVRVQRNSDRSATVFALFQSVLDGQQFDTSTEFTQ